MRLDVFVGVGSSIDPEKNIFKGLRRLQGECGLKAISMFYRSPALNRPTDPDFYNGAVKLTTDLEAEKIKGILKMSPL